MARRPATAQSSIELMCRSLVDEGTLMRKSISHYRTDCAAVLKILENNGRENLPWKLTEDDVRWLIQHLQTNNYAVSTRKGYLNALKKLTSFYGNDPFRNIKILWPHDERPNARWLNSEEVSTLLSLPKSPVEDLVIHCELCLGMRRVEVLRLTTSSFSGSYVDVLGKGHAGGKPRRIPYHPKTASVYARYALYRAEVVDSVKVKSPNATVPDDLLIWSNGSSLRTYGEKGTGLDRMVADLGKKMGKRISHHDLRRTFGRSLFQSGVSLSVIQKILGHDSPVTTTKYLGVDLDDMDNAMKLLYY